MMTPPLLGRARRFVGRALGREPISRESLARQFLAGDGIEIGALHHPLVVPRSARVRYVDRMSVADLRTHYPELAAVALVPLDVIDDGERLAAVADGSEDFVIANHFLEHCEDPISTLANAMRVLKPGGVVYLAVPDKRTCFDRGRPVTSVGHVVADYENGPDAPRGRSPPMP